ncbi:hypothetical protein AN958_12321 [Leucoagaricus sp. SymC.cos]|nr:hypothetical protein AN958_12321 [Leucoagaricus sp. SymC.cos]
MIQDIQFSRSICFTLDPESEMIEDVREIRVVVVDVKGQFLETFWQGNPTRRAIRRFIEGEIGQRLCPDS